VAAQVANWYPQTPGSTNNYVFASPQNQDPRHWDFRADEVLTDKQNLFPVYRRLGWLRREQYANIEGPKIAELSPNEPKATIEQAISYQSIPLIPGPLSGSAGGPEKAGVGGSIPSMAVRCWRSNRTRTGVHWPYCRLSGVCRLYGR
jgi:hypothetical protein